MSDLNKKRPLVMVGTVVPAEGDYLEGYVTVEGGIYPFNYNVRTEEVEVHCFSNPGWMTGACYEKPLPKIVTDNMELIIDTICESARGFLEVNERAVDSILEDASLPCNKGTRDMGTGARDCMDK